jgi:hypothetical protein
MERTSTVFDRLRALETQGQPLHALIVDACEVGNGLVAAADAAFYFLGGTDDAATVRALLLHAINRAYSDNGHTPDNGKAAA